MPATTTLSTTTLTQNVSASAGAIRVSSTSGLAPNVRLFLDGELMKVKSLGVDAGADVNVYRGVDGTQARQHNTGATLYVGEAHQFFSYDPAGVPEDVILVSPHINTQNGAVWFARGGPSTSGRRWWQKQEATVTTGALGIQAVTYEPTSST